MAKAPIETRLMNKAVDYLGRYASSQYRLRDVLDRFATRKLDQHDPDKIAAAIDATVTRCQTLGYVNDDAFAQSQARSHRRQGRSQLGIRQRLRQHRLDDGVIDAALEVADEHAADGELLAACRFARRRRIGPFDHRRNDENNRDAIMQRQLGAMARAGFAMAISRKVFDLADSTAGESLIDQLEHGEDPTL
ncbi:recombination regulator RecX [Alphaproteobacteria bacterium]|nr:recombination regulator RecX [Alphaproteobacteria bacterium]